MYVLHCDIQLWVLATLVGAWVAREWWRKVEYVARVEFLAAVFDLEALSLPSFVLRHDAQLEGQALLDFGIVTVGEAQGVAE